jgi:hypothetical protein
MYQSRFYLFDSIRMFSLSTFFLPERSLQAVALACTALYGEICVVRSSRTPSNELQELVPFFQIRRFTVFPIPRFLLLPISPVARPPQFPGHVSDAATR